MSISIDISLGRQSTMTLSSLIPMSPTVLGGLDAFGTVVVEQVEVPIAGLVWRATLTFAGILTIDVYNALLAVGAGCALEGTSCKAQSVKGS